MQERLVENTDTSLIPASEKNPRVKDPTAKLGRNVKLGRLKDDMEVKAWREVCLKVGTHSVSERCPNLGRLCTGR